jgi:hypothetical protein
MTIARKRAGYMVAASPAQGQEVLGQDLAGDLVGVPAFCLRHAARASPARRESFIVEHHDDDTANLIITAFTSRSPR